MGATIAIGVIVPVVVLAAAVGFFMLWRRRRREAFGAAAINAPNGDQTELQQSQAQPSDNKVYYSGVPQELSASWQAVEMPGARTIAELPGDARLGSWQHQSREK
jgi:hypothetical protein